MKSTPGPNNCVATNTNYIPMLAANGNCCSWVKSPSMFNQGVLGMGLDNNYCGSVITRPLGPEERKTCCDAENTLSPTSYGDCEDVSRGHGAAYRNVLQFAISEDSFFTSFKSAWKVATSNGANGLKLLSDGPTTSTVIEKNMMDKFIDSIFNPTAPDTKPATDFDIAMNDLFGTSTTTS